MQTLKGVIPMMLVRLNLSSGIYDLSLHFILIGSFQFLKHLILKKVEIA